MTRPPFARSIEDQIASLADEGEVDGAIKQITEEGRMTPRIKNLLEAHRVLVLQARTKQ